MAKITELPAAGPITGAETLALVQDGEMVQAPLEDAAAPTIAKAEAWALAAEMASEIVASNSSNLIDPGAAGWLTDFRNNPPNGIPVALVGWDTTPFIPVQAGTYVTNLEGYAVLYDENEVFQANLNVSAYWASPVLTVPSAGLVRLSAQRSGNYARSRMFFQPGSDWPAVVEPFGKIFNDETLFNADGAGLADQSVGPEKLQTWELGANRAKPNGRVDGYYMATNGSPVSSTTYSYWPAIAVEPGQVWTANQSMRFVTFYDAAGRARSTVGITTSVTQFTVPAGCYYAVPTSTASTVGTFAIALGATVPTWTPYGWRGRSSLPDGTPLLWGTPEGSELVSTLDTELGGSAWRNTSAVPDSYGLARLRETRQRLRLLRSGIVGANAQINIGFMGDSFTHDSGRYVLKVARALWGKYHAGHANVLYGPIGPGWIGFNGVGSGSFPNGTIYWNNIASGGGGWTTANGTGNGPDSGRETSSTAGAWIQFGWSRFSEGHTFRLFAEGGAGVVRYRWTDAGAWTEIDLSALAAGVQIITLAGAPASGSGTIRIEVVSGTVALYGVDVRLPTTAGVIVHKLGGTGTRLQQWAALSATRFQANVAGLGLNLVAIMHGTNDQGAGRTKAQFKADLLTLIDRVRTARPTADILLITPPENQRVNSVPMSDYAAAMYEVALDSRDVAFLNLQNAFGVVPADYAAGSARPWWNLDGIHPENEPGGYAICDLVLFAIGEQGA